jgi:hypothetical protein
LSFAVTISVAMTAARSAPRSEPANSQHLRPRANLRSARSAAIVGQADTPVVDKARKIVPASVANPFLMSV